VDWIYTDGWLSSVLEGRDPLCLRSSKPPSIASGELSDAAKDKARAWYREGGFDYDWYDAVYEDFQRIAEILGLPQDPHRPPDGRRHPAGTLHLVPGFWSQGDGACFESFYSYRKHAPRRDPGIRAAGHRTAPHRRCPSGDPAPQLLSASRRCQPSRPLLSRILHGDLGRARQPDLAGHDRRCRGDVIEALRDLARWLYRQLEREYDYLSSDEAVDETIAANEYTFTEAGRRFG
jgi:hypothetical protein